MNPRMIRLMMIKPLATHNTGGYGEKKMKFQIQTANDDQHMLMDGRNYTECKTVFENLESILNFYGLIHMILWY